MDYKIKEELKRCSLDNKIEYIALFSGDKHFVSELKDCLDAGKFVKIFSFKKRLSEKIKKLCKAHPKAEYISLDEEKIRERLEFKVIDKRGLDKTL